MSRVGLIAVSWNNNQYLFPCVQSILASDPDVNIYVVNNGEQQNMRGLDDPRITILQQDRNKGWEGGLIEGLKASTEEFVILMNDDTFIPPSSKNWIKTMLKHFDDPKVGAVGPSSNVVMGGQSIFSYLPIDSVFRSTFLVNFCCMVRRSALDASGGVDDSLPGGDDLDQSIRMRKAGYDLLIDRNTFVYHHGFKTGERVKGGPNVDGGWNSVTMTEKTNFALINKHGLRAWMETMSLQILGVYEFQQA